MTEFKGTPGKWQVLHYGTSNPDNGNCGAHRLNVDVEVWFSDSHACKSVDEAKANAILISKAPEMLKTLECVLKLGEGAIITDQHIDAIKQLIKEATEF